jgi:hypothetical protein
MKIEIETKNILPTLKRHLFFVLPVSLYTLSWFAVHQVGCSCDAVQVWWGFVSTLTFIGGTITSVIGIHGLIHPNGCGY